MKLTNVLLYRERGAIGAASHYAKESIGESGRYEFLGISGLTEDGRVPFGMVACVKYPEELQS